MDVSPTPDNSVHFETWQLFSPFYLIYCIPVTIHYLLVLRIINKLKNSNAFFLIFYIVGISDFLYCFAILACELLHHTTVAPIVVFVAFVIFGYFGVFFNIISSLLLSINRFCAARVSYNTYFSDYRTKQYLLIIFPLSIVATIPGGAVISWYYKADWSLSQQLQRTGLQSFVPHRSILITLLLIDGILGLALNSATMCRLRKLRINYDKSLLTVTSLHIFPAVLVTFFNMDMTFHFTGQSVLTNELSRICLLFLVSFNSLTIVCTNRIIRKKYIAFFVSTLFPKYEISTKNNSVANITQVTDRITVL